MNDLFWLNCDLVYSSKFWWCLMNLALNHVQIGTNASEIWRCRPSRRILTSDVHFTAPFGGETVYQQLSVGAMLENVEVCCENLANSCNFLKSLGWVHDPRSSSGRSLLEPVQKNACKFQAPLSPTEVTYSKNTFLNAIPQLGTCFQVTFTCFLLSQKKETCFPTLDHCAGLGLKASNRLTKAVLFWDVQSHPPTFDPLPSILRLFNLVCWKILTLLCKIHT